MAEYYRENAPIKIPESASVKVQSMTNGYEQIKYEWSAKGYAYEVRWHTRTPGAPVDQGNTWVVRKRLPGEGGRMPQNLYKIGENEWVTGKMWHDAVTARSAGTATTEQIEILNKGHWKE